MTQKIAYGKLGAGGTIGLSFSTGTGIIPRIMASRPSLKPIKPPVQ
jgi:hypothetical protein